MVRETHKDFINKDWDAEIEVANTIKREAEKVERMQDFIFEVSESQPSDFKDLVNKALQIVEDLGR